MGALVKMRLSLNHFTMPASSPDFTVCVRVCVCVMKIHRKADLYHIHKADLYLRASQRFGVVVLIYADASQHDAVRYSTL